MISSVACELASVKLAGTARARACASIGRDVRRATGGNSTLANISMAITARRVVPVPENVITGGFKSSGHIFVAHDHTKLGTIKSIGLIRCKVSIVVVGTIVPSEVGAIRQPNGVIAKSIQRWIYKTI